MDLNRSNIKKIIGIITFAILLYVGLQKLDIVMGFLASIFALIFPFLLGGGIAFILNVPMRGLEHIIYRQHNPKKQSLNKAKRPISLLITLIIVIGVILLVLVLVVQRLGGPSV